MNVVANRGAVTSPTLAGAVSRKEHGEAGDLDIELLLGSVEAVGVECRTGGPTQVILTFSEEVEAIDGVLNASEVELSVGALESVSIAGSEMAINISGVPDASCLEITVTGVADLTGNPLTGADEIHIAVLAGDTNGDGQTNLIDMAQTKSKNGSPVVGDDIRFDVNVDGNINLIDMAAVKALNGGSVTCP